MLQVALLCLLLGSAHSFTLSKKIFDKTEEPIDSGEVGRVFAHGPKDNTTKEDDFSISALLEKANKNLGKRPTDPKIQELDIVVGFGLQNADPCTSWSCKWPKATDGNVYVPYFISNQYSQNERAFIEDSMHSIARRTCIRFFPRTTQQDYIYILSHEGCYSSVGRQGGAQAISLERPGCLYRVGIQHEMFHALGFRHEHSRSDRDQHVEIKWENIEPGKENNFYRAQTNNLNTPYDYGSIMHYGRDFFSVNGKPTIVPIPNRNVAIGTARQMSNNDLLRVNRLYNC